MTNVKNEISTMRWGVERTVDVVTANTSVGTLVSVTMRAVALSFRDIWRDVFLTIESELK